MNKKLLLASTGAAVIAAAGFGSIALAQDDGPTSPSDGPSEEASGGASEGTGGASGELDAVPDDTAAGEGQAVFPSDGGTVFAECTDDGPELVWWVAADGYVVDDVEAVPDDEWDDDDDDAEVEFTDGATDVDYDVTCADGQPQANITVEDDRDGDRDDDGSDDSGSDDDGSDDGDDDHGGDRGHDDDDHSGHDDHGDDDHDD